MAQLNLVRKVIWLSSRAYNKIRYRLLKVGRDDRVACLLGKMRQLKFRCFCQRAKSFAVMIIIFYPRVITLTFTQDIGYMFYKGNFSCKK